MNGEMIKEFLVGLGFQVDEKGLSEFTQGIASTTTRVMAFGAAITATAAGVLYSIQQIAKSYNELDLLATRLKTTTEALDDFLDIASIMGIGEDKAKESLLGLNSAIQDTEIGIGSAKMVFEKLGVSVKDAQGNIPPRFFTVSQVLFKVFKNFSPAAFQLSKKPDTSPINNLAKALINSITPSIKERKEAFIVSIAAINRLIAGSHLVQSIKLSPPSFHVIKSSYRPSMATPTPIIAPIGVAKKPRLKAFHAKSAAPK